eukprot:3751104-Prymnesium_polylepis.1
MPVLSHTTTCRPCRIAHSRCPSTNASEWREARTRDLLSACIPSVPRLGSHDSIGVWYVERSWNNYFNAIYRAAQPDPEEGWPGVACPLGVCYDGIDQRVKDSWNNSIATERFDSMRYQVGDSTSPRITQHEHSRRRAPKHALLKSPSPPSRPAQIDVAMYDAARNLYTDDLPGPGDPLRDCTEFPLQVTDDDYEEFGANITLNEVQTKYVENRQWPSAPGSYIEFIAKSRTPVPFPTDYPSLTCEQAVVTIDL